jgi:hypothetical protein
MRTHMYARTVPDIGLRSLTWNPHPPPSWPCPILAPAAGLALGSAADLDAVLFRAGRPKVDVS